MIRVRRGISTTGAWEDSESKDNNKDNRSGSSSENTYHQAVTSLLFIMSVLLVGNTPVVIIIFLSPFFSHSRLLTNILNGFKKQINCAPSVQK